MQIGKIVTTKRAKAAIAAVLAISTTIGGVLYAKKPGDEPRPAAVTLAVDYLIIPWEGLVLSSHWDRFSERYDICHGDTLINGKPVRPGMHFTKEQCHDILMTRVTNDYYNPLTRCIADFDKKPLALQAMLISGAYNFGVNGTARRPGACQSTGARLTREGNYQAACRALLPYVKSNGKFVQGLANRRGNGDASRIGEAELCVSGVAA